MQKPVRWLITHRAPFLVASLFVLPCILAVLSSESLGVAQMTKASVVSTALKSTPLSKWTRDLGYKRSALYTLTIGSTGCPLIDVNISGVKVPLILDSGTARGFSITDYAPKIPYHPEGPIEELNPDGSHRGESLAITIDTISVLEQVFTNVRGGLTDWQMSSSEPFNGGVGFDFFLDRRLTLDYRSEKVGVTKAPLPWKLDSNRYVTIVLIDPPKPQGHVLYVRAQVNRKEAIVYLDAGLSVSFIEPNFAKGLDRIERPGRFKVFRKGVPVELGGRTFILDDLRENTINRGPGFDRPVALELGSDLLSRFVVTIDLRAKKLILAMAE
jgi:hypothetical protein